MQRAGIVDLGSNTARLVVYEFEPEKWFRLIDEIREPIRLGQGLDPTHGLDDAALDRATEALTLYSDYSEATALDSLEVIATSAVRDAENQKELLKRARRLGLRVAVLSGEAEAQLGVLAVANGFDVEDAWVVDVGGGSAQISRMEQRRPVECASFPLGGVRLSENFLVSDPPEQIEVEELEQEVAERLGKLPRRIRKSDAPIVAMGGTVRNLARAAQRSDRYRLEMLHGYRLTLEDLEELTERLLGMRSAKRGRLAGIHPDRADAAVAGALIFRWLLRETKREELRISGQGIREGAFYRNFVPAPYLIPDLRRFSVQNLFERYPQPRRHTQRVRKLAAMLFDGLEPLHRLGSRDRELLDAAATLHDIGKAVNYYDHDVHGAYLVLSAPLPGYDHAEQALISTLVRYHRKGSPKPGALRPLLDRGMRRALYPLTACLRLAEKLERSRAGRVRDLSVELRKRVVRIELVVKDSAFVELWEAQKQAALFRKAFGKRVQLVTAGS